VSQLLCLAILFKIEFTKIMLYFTLSTAIKINTLNFADGQVIIADSEDNLKRGVFTLQT
jgi:hypothetical protein